MSATFLFCHSINMHTKCTYTLLKHWNTELLYTSAAYKTFMDTRDKMVNMLILSYSQDPPLRMRMQCNTISSSFHIVNMYAHVKDKTLMSPSSWPHVTWWWELAEAVEAGAPSLPGSEDSEESLMVRLWALWPVVAVTLCLTLVSRLPAKSEAEFPHILIKLSFTILKL